MSEVLTEAALPTVSATFNGRVELMPEIINTLQAVNGLWHLCADLAVEIAEGETGVPVNRREIRELSHVQIRKQSPLWLEVGQQLIYPGGAVVGGLGLLAWCLKHPGEIAGFLPTLKETWHRGQHQAAMAKEERLAYEAQVKRVAIPIESAEPGDVDMSDIVPDYDSVSPWQQM